MWKRMENMLVKTVFGTEGDFKKEKHIGPDHLCTAPSSEGSLGGRVRHILFPSHSIRGRITFSMDYSPSVP